MKRGEQSIRFVATGILLLLLAGILIGGSFALMFVEKFPSTDSLVYETCTFEKCERISSGKYADYYFIYVEEYDKPLKIDSIASRAIDPDALQKVRAGDVIVVSKDEGRRSFTLYSLSHGDATILAYEDFLETQDGNDSVGAAVMGVFSLLPIGLFIANVIHYRKTGRSLPAR